MVRRVEALLTDMGWDEIILAKRIYPQLGYKGPKAVQQWFQRAESRKLHTLAVIVIAEELGIDPSYILGVTDDLPNSVDPEGRYALAVFGGRAGPSKPRKARRSA